MMYVFICPKCGHTRMVSLLRELECTRCSAQMANCEIDFLDWVDLNWEERMRLVYFYKNVDPKELCFYRPMPFYDHWERGYW